jgi:hypothetical protein
MGYAPSSGGDNRRLFAVCVRDILKNKYTRSMRVVCGRRKLVREILVELGASGGRTPTLHRKSSRRCISNFLRLHLRLHNLTTHNTTKMRPLTEPETKTLFEKLATYCGKGISNLIADPSGGSDRNVFRVQVNSTAPCNSAPGLHTDSRLGLKSLLCPRIPCQPRHIRCAR